MREIKFRAWKKSESRYVLWNELLSNPEHLKLVLERIMYESLEQFTGQKDKKRTEEYPDGQEIYEGDKVKAPAMGTDAICEVFWGINCWCLKDQNGLTTGLYPHGGEFTPEVIGNIHENPKAKE